MGPEGRQRETVGEGRRRCIKSTELTEVTCGKKGVAHTNRGYREQVTL